MLAVVLLEPVALPVDSVVAAVFLELGVTWNFGWGVFGRTGEPGTETEGWGTCGAGCKARDGGRTAAHCVEMVALEDVETGLGAGS